MCKGQIYKRQFLSRPVSSRHCDNSICESFYLDSDRESEWLDSPRCCWLVIWCLVAFGLYLAIVCIAIKVYIDSNKLQQQHRFETKLPALDIKPAVKCEFDIEDAPFMKSGAESTHR
jgi:hypothetical protein